MSKKKSVKVKITHQPLLPVGVRIKNPWQFLIDTGLLWHMNDKIFHPLGLGFLQTDDGSDCFTLLDDRNYPVRVFSPEDFEDGQNKMKKYIKEIGRDTMQKRQEILGFIVQNEGE